MSPRKALLTMKLPLSPAAVGSAWSAFLRPFEATSPTLTQPVPLQPDPEALPINTPVSALIRYMTLPALGPEGPRLGIDASTSGKYPEPTITALTDRSLFRGPTAGSDQVKPTVFSAYVADADRSPKNLMRPPGVPSVTVNVLV